ncbi:MAG: acetoacetate metabolism transcriptional regulator AtoC [Geothermobacteraceae bacterium]
MTARPELLIVEDDVDHGRMLEVALASEGYPVRVVTCGQDAIEQLGHCSPQIVLLDIRLPDFDGFQLLDIFKQRCPDCIVVMMTGQASISDAVEAMRLGAYDYLAKPFRIELLLLKLERLGQLRQLQWQNRELQEKLGRKGSVMMVGASEPFKKAMATLMAAATTDATVLIQGETGTGKELAARLIHQQSERSSGPMVAVNCGAIPTNLLESELFGHERGAYTGAQKRHRGYLEQASGGTLFLDEVGEIPLEMQVKLLRVLEERVLFRLGGEQKIDVDFRLVTATNRDLREMMLEGSIRQDFFYRLNVVQVHLPPLRERSGDLPLLASLFVRRHAKKSGLPAIHLAPETIDALAEWQWPGNVRELDHLIEQLQVLYPGETILPSHLPAQFRKPQSGSDLLHGVRTELSLKEALRDFERRFIARVLEEEGDNRTRAAQRLGISRKNLWEKLTR